MIEKVGPLGGSEVLTPKDIARFLINEVARDRAGLIRALKFRGSDDETFRIPGV